MSHGHLGWWIAVALLVYLSVPLAAWILTLVQAAWNLVRGSGSEVQRVGGDHVVPLLFLVPAHNEESVIGDCIQSLLAQDYPSHMRSVVVIADNCSDGTAKVAGDLGAECLVRTAADRPGKPHAIAWALESVGDLARWEACVIVDADSLVPADFAAKLSGHAPLRTRLVQPYNTISNPTATWLTRLGAVLGRARYEVEYPLRQAAGLNCPLTGNGMCLGTDLLARDGWQAFSLTENWEIYADYTTRGVETALVNDARIYSVETESMAASRTRRSRWSRGRLQVLHGYWKKILTTTRISWHQKLNLFADLSGLPPTIHALASVGLAASFFFVFADGVTTQYLGAVALASALPLVSTSAIALVKDPEPAKATLALLALPLYVVWRGWLLLDSLFTNRESVWRKTERVN